MTFVGTLVTIVSSHSDILTKSSTAPIWKVALSVPFWNCTTPLLGLMSVALGIMAGTCQYTYADPNSPTPRWMVKVAAEVGSNPLPGLGGSSRPSRTTNKPNSSFVHAGENAKCAQMYQIMHACKTLEQEAKYGRTSGCHTGPCSTKEIYSKRKQQLFFPIKFDHTMIT